MDLMMEDKALDLEGYADLDGVPQGMVESTVWLSPADDRALAAFRLELPNKLILFTLMWSSIHVASVLLCPLLSNPNSSMSKKDRLLWHNKIVSSAHAAVAFVQGFWWIFLSGEWEQTHDKLFGFFPANAYIAAMGVSYFIYDTIFCVSAAKYMKGEYLPQILMHHVIFLLAYYSTLVYPATLSVTTYHLFQLTELSTVFLHGTWMQSKAQVDYTIFFYSSAALLGTFIQRLFTNAFCVWHVFHHVIGDELYQINVPKGYGMYRYYHMAYFVIGTCGMMAMNISWFSALVARAKDTIKRVKNGKPPTPDYERPPLKKSE